jgi:ABC-type transport system involved in multi-copper enzyme maturation permease subunit
LHGIYVSLHAIFLFSLSYLLWLALPDLLISTIWSSLLVTLTFLIAMVFYLNTPRACILIGVSLIVTVTILIDMQIHKLQMFLTTRKLGGILAENERMTLQNRAQEMRHMIGNVAHDLKTVSIACSPSSLILTSFPFLCSRLPLF